MLVKSKKPRTHLKRTVIVSGHKTAVSLETVFWNELQRIASERGITRSALISEIDAKRTHQNLTRACRLFVVKDLKMRAFPSSI